MNQLIKTVPVFLLMVFALLVMDSCRNELIDEIELMREEAIAPVLEISYDGKTTISPGSVYDCGLISIGNTFEITFQISNNGKSNLEIDPSQLTLAMDNMTEENTFTLVTPPSKVVAMNENASFTIRFAPVSEGAKSASIKVVTNDPETPEFNFVIKGTGWNVILSTNIVTSVETSSAMSGGNITDDGGVSITERGVCWSTSPNPTLANSHSSDGGLGEGYYSCQMTGLNGGTLYYVRAYASNGISTGYGTQVSFTTKPSAPSGVTVSAVPYADGSGELVVSWVSSNNSSTEFDLYYCNISDGENRPVDANGPTGLTTTTHTLSGLDNYDTYNVWVVARNAAGSSAFSSVGSSKVGIPVTGITLTLDSGYFLPGVSETINVSVTPLTATNQSVDADSWSSGDTNSATVSNGVVTGGSASSTNTIISVAAADEQGAVGTLSVVTQVYSSGMTGPSGGVIFYDSGAYNNGWRYLEVASSYKGGLSFFSSNGAVPPNTVEGYGDGKENTETIITSLGAGDYLAMACKNHEQNGYTDWYMPSEYEVEAIYSIDNSDYLRGKNFISSSVKTSGLTRIYIRLYSGTGEYAFPSTAADITWPVRRF